MSRTLKLLIGIPLLFVLLVVGGTFFYIHVVEGTAPPPLSVDAGTPATAASPGASPGASPAGDASAPLSLDGTWKVGPGSVAGYRVQETLFGQSNTAVGRTTALTGSLTVSGGTVTAGSFSADLTKVASDRNQRDQQFQGRIMDTADFPTATFKLTQPVVLGAAPADGVTVPRQVTGDLTLHGTTRSVTFTATIKRSEDSAAASGSIPVVFADYGIDNPSFAGVVTTQDHGTLEFQLEFTAA